MFFYRLGLLPFALLFLILLSSACSLGQSPNSTITLDGSVHHQTITGWEATAHAGEVLETTSVTGASNANPAFALYSKQLFDLLVDDLGINRLRVEIGEGAENSIDYFTQFLNGEIPFEDSLSQKSPVNDDNDPFSVDAFISKNPNSAIIPGFYFSWIDYRMDTMVLPLREKLQANGESLFLNVCYVAFVSNPYMQYTDAEEYAEFVLATYQHLKVKYGIVPDAWEVILEPDNTQFDGTRIGQAVKAASARLRKFGFTPRFILPSVTNMNNMLPYYEEAKNVLGDNGISQDVIELAYHRYGLNNGLLPAIAAEAKNRGINTSMLEHIGSGYVDLHMDLKHGNNSAWQRFVIGDYYPCCSEAKYFNIDQSNPLNPKVVMVEDSKFLRQYFRYVRKGAVRIEADTSNPFFDPVAFINTNGSHVVVVKTNGKGAFSVQGLPAGTYGINFTTDGQYNIDLKDVTLETGQKLETTIPAKGVITIYAKTNTASSAQPPQNPP